MSLLSHKLAQQTIKIGFSEAFWYAIRPNSFLKFESVKRKKNIMFINKKINPIEGHVIGAFHLI